jgi:hypothetical protein
MCAMAAVRSTAVWLLVVAMVASGLWWLAPAVAHTATLRELTRAVASQHRVEAWVLAFAAQAALLAWALAEAAALGAQVSGRIAAATAALLVLGSPPWRTAGVGGTVAVVIALLAVAAARRLAQALSSTSGIAGGAAPLVGASLMGNAAAAALGVAVATALDPSFGALALPVLALWWQRVGRVRRRLVPPGPRRRWRAAGLWIAPSCLAAALAMAVVAWQRGGAIWGIGLHAGERKVASLATAPTLRALGYRVAELLGPTAAVAAVAGLWALALAPRKGGGEGASGRWLASMVAAIVVGSTVSALRQRAIGAAMVIAAALAIAVAIQRLAVAVEWTPSPRGGDERGEPSRGGAGSITSGSIAVALAVGFLVLAPSFL